MKIAVCIKQVPDATNVWIDPATNTLVREGVESVANPSDLFALEQALRLKDAHGAEVTVVSMGPPQAESVLREALARGADSAFLVSSRAFAGADTLATSHVLSRAILKACGEVMPELVLFGKQAIDGDTAQVGPGVSEFLGLPLVPYAKGLELSGDGYRVVTVMDDGERVIEGAFPVAMTVTPDAEPPRFASLAGMMRASRMEIPVLDERAIGVDSACVGLVGSPTRVARTFPPSQKRKGRTVVWTGDVAGLAKEIREAIHG